MADKMRRHSRRAKHLMRVLRRSKHASTQDMASHELVREIDRRHGFLRLGRRRPAAMPRPGMPGHWRPMTRRARQILNQLRKTKVWRLQKQLVRELQKELANGRRAIDKARDLARRAARRAGRAGRRVRRGAEALGRDARRAGRATARGGLRAGRSAKRGGQWARPRLAAAGRRARDTSRRWQEPMLKRAERRHAARHLPTATAPQWRIRTNPATGKPYRTRSNRVNGLPVRVSRPRRARMPRRPVRVR